MAAARYSQDVLEEFFGEIPRRETLQSPTTDLDLEEILNLDPAELDAEMAIQTGYKRSKSRKKNITKGSVILRQRRMATLFRVHRWLFGTVANFGQSRIFALFI